MLSEVSLLNLKSFDAEVVVGAVVVVECEVTVVEAFYLKTKKNLKVFQKICMFYLAWKIQMKRIWYYLLQFKDILLVFKSRLRI